MSDEELAREAGQLLAMLRAGMRILSLRALSFLAMAMGFGMACWAMWDPTWQRMGLVLVWVVFVYLPVLWREHKDGT